MMSATGDYAQGFLDLLFPPRCQVCGRTGASFCAACRGAIEPPPDSLLQGGVSEVVSVGVHGGPLRDAVIRLKFNGRLSLVAPLGELLAVRVSERMDEWQPDLLVPVPIHWFRHFQRGFNQSEVLARAVARRAGVPVEQRALVRTRFQHAQVGLSAQARRANIAGSVAVRHPARLQGRRIVLIDDVCTTGATLAECARAAREEGGAAAVFAVTLTREAS